MIETRITGQRGKNSTISEAHVHPFETATGNHSGLVTLNHPFVGFNPEVHPFLNTTFGTAMNQNVTFSGTPEGIHNGTDTIYWTASAISGNWTFASTTNPQTGTRCIDGTATANNNEALFSLSGLYADVMMGDFTAITGGVRLENFVTGHEVQVRFRLGGADVGNFINIYDLVDTGTLNAYQNFVIPKADMGLTDQEVDEFVVKTVKTTGQNPNYRLDNIQIEQIGTPLVFKATTPLGTRFHITEIRIGLADALVGTLSDGTMPALAYDKILGVSALTNGITFSRIQKGEVEFSVSLKQLGDFLSTGSNLINAISDGTNTFIALLVEFPEPIVLLGDDGNNFLSFTIADDLSGLLQFNASARGAIEV